MRKLVSNYSEDDVLNAIDMLNELEEKLALYVKENNIPFLERDRILAAEFGPEIRSVIKNVPEIKHLPAMAGRMYPATNLVPYEEEWDQGLSDEQIVEKYGYEKANIYDFEILPESGYIVCHYVGQPFERRFRQLYYPFVILASTYRYILRQE